MMSLFSSRCRPGKDMIPACTAKFCYLSTQHVECGVGIHSQKCGGRSLLYPGSLVGVYQGAIAVFTQGSLFALYAVLKCLQFTVAHGTTNGLTGLEFLPQKAAVCCRFTHVFLLDADAWHGAQLIPEGDGINAARAQSPVVNVRPAGKSRGGKTLAPSDEGKSRCGRPRCLTHARF